MKLSDFYIELKDFEQYKTILEITINAREQNKIKRFWLVVKLHLMIANFYIFRFFRKVKNWLKLKIKSIDFKNNKITNYFKINKEELIDNQIYRYKLFTQSLTNKLRYDLEVEEDKKKYARKNKRISNLIHGDKYKIPKIRFNEKLAVGFLILRTPTKIFYILISFFSLSKTLQHNFISDTIVSYIIFHIIILFVIYHLFSVQLKERIKKENWEVFITWDYKENFVELDEDFKSAKNGGLRWITEEEKKAMENEVSNETRENVNTTSVPFASVWEKYFSMKHKNIWGEKQKYPEFIEADATATEIYVMPYAEITHSDYMKDRELISTLMKKPIYRIHDDWGGVHGKVAIEFAKTKWIPPYTFDDVIDTGKENVVVLGKSVKEDITWDMNSMPHAMIIGGTGSGKSVTSKNWIRQFVEKEHLLYIVDLKGGTENTIFTHKGYTVFSEREECLELLNKLYVEQTFRNKLFVKTSLKETEKQGEIIEIKDRKEYNEWAKKNGCDLLPRIVVFVDEWSNATSDKDEISEQIISVIAKLLKECRSSGINFIFALQRPDAKFWGGGATRGQIGLIYANKMNATDGTYAKEVLGVEDAIKLPVGENIGHAYVKDETGLLVLVRSPYEDNEKFAKRVSGWRENPHKDYVLHKLEDEISFDNIYKARKDKTETAIIENSNEGFDVRDLF